MEEVPQAPDFDFSLEKFENAMVSIQNQDDNLAGALQYVQAWELTQPSIFQACEILKSSQNQIAHFFAALALDHKIPHVWKLVNKENREQIIKFISERIFMYENNLVITATLARALAHIAVYDFPEEWEGYDTYLFPDNENNATFLMLEAFFTDSEESKFITEHRRQQLRNSLNRKVEFFLPRIQTALTNPELAEKAICTYTAMVKWAPGSAISIEFVQAIFTQFIINQSTTQVSVDCLKRIFLRRTDSASIFDRFKYIILESLSTVKLPTGLLITNIPTVLKFAISICYRYMMPIEKMIIQSSDTKSQQYLTSIITTILSVRDNIPNKLWMMWFDIFQRIVDQNLNTMPLKYSSIIFKPMLPIIMQNLYEMLPYSVDEDGTLRVQAQNSFAKLVEVDYEAVQTFLEPQVSSPSLCYALGCLMSVRAPKQDMASFVQIVEVLFEDCKSKIESDDEAYIIALMFGFSRSASFLSTLGHFGRFLEIVISCLQNSSEKLSQAAIYALLYTARNDPELFMADDTKIILDNLIQMSETFVIQLPDESAVRIFECLLILIDKMNEPQKIQELFGPVVAILQNPALEKPVRTALFIISKLSKYKVSQPNQVPRNQLPQPQNDVLYGMKFAPFVIGPTCQLAKAVVVSHESNIEDIELLLNALAALISCYESYQAAEESIKGCLALFFERRQILPCFFNFITSVRKNQKFFDMNSLFQNIMESFVFPIIPEDVSVVPDDAPLAEILNMVASFEKTNINIEWIIKVGLGQGLISYNKEVNEAAANAVVRVFREMETPDLRSLFMQIGVKVFVAIFQSLADSMHKPSSTALIRMIYDICLLIMNGIEVPNELKDFIFQALQSVFQNDVNDESLFNKFIEFIVNTLSAIGNTSKQMNFKQFEDGVANFLIMQNKYSPGDASEFKIYNEPADPFFFLF